MKDVCQADCKMHVCSVVAKFPYLVSKKRKEGEELRRVAQFDWRIIERSIERSLDSSFEAAGLTFTPLPVCNSWHLILLSSTAVCGVDQNSLNTKTWALHNDHNDRCGGGRWRVSTIHIYAPRSLIDAVSFILHQCLAPTHALQPAFFHNSVLILLEKSESPDSVSKVSSKNSWEIWSNKCM